MLGSFSGSFKAGRRLPVVAVATGQIIYIDATNPSSLKTSDNNYWYNLLNSDKYYCPNLLRYNLDGTYTTGQGECVRYNPGSYTYTELGYPLAANTNFTFEVWLKFNSVTGKCHILSSNNTCFYVNSGVLTGSIGHGTSGENFSDVSYSSVTTGTWYQVALTFNDSTNTARLFVNGSQVAENTNVTTSYPGSYLGDSGGYFRIGAIEKNTPFPTMYYSLSAYVARARVYNVALTAADISQNFEAKRSLVGL